MMLFVCMAALCSGIVFFVTRNLWTQKILVCALSGVIIAASAGLYALIGQPFIKLTSSAPSQTQIEDVVAKLKTRLVENPKEAETWRMLGWVEFNASRYQESQNAYAKAVEIDPINLDYQSAMAEAMVQVAKGVITPEAQKIFSDVLAKNPGEARSRFYSAMAREQAGDQKGALNLWVAMLKEAKASDGWREEVAKHADGLAKALGQQSAALDILKQKPDDQLDMIKGMVAGLAAKMENDPQNVEGWIKLMRAYMVLKEPEKAKATLQQALKVFEGDVTLLTNAANELGVAH
jgi:cytochrome c-type biogenesis protein CcmH